jgi:AraC family transcriptional regulator
MKPETQSFYLLKVTSTVQHIAAHLDGALDLGSLANEACLSPFHFHRVFRGMVGETPMELIRRLRLERAAWQLGNSGSSVTQVAFAAGYETHEAFTRAFRANYGTPPSGFRHRTQKRIELAASCGVHFNPDGQPPHFIPRDSGGRNMEVEIREMPELRVATLRHIGPYNQIGTTFAKLGGIAGAAGLFELPGAAMVALYHDDPETKPVDELRSDAGVVVPKDTTLPKELAEQKIPAGRYARTVHIGGFETLGDTWSRLMGEWLPASGHRLSDGASYERYVSDMRTTPKEQLVTEILVSVE